jgi:ATP-dependent exoDNAse (exonuclease V) alpha subunit
MASPPQIARASFTSSSIASRRGSVCATGHCFDAFFRSELTGGILQELHLSVGFDGRSVTYGFGEVDTLVPAYASSIHKSQGSEYPAVVIPVMTQH